MCNSDKNAGYRYWKRPWHKWIILAGAISQFIGLWLKLREYQKISMAGIFTASAWEGYAAQSNLQCAILGLSAICLLGIFLIGAFARNQRTVRLVEGVFLLFLAFIWGTVGLALHLTARIFWVLILLLTVGSGIYDLWRYQKKDAPH